MGAMRTASAKSLAAAVAAWACAWPAEAATYAVLESSPDAITVLNPTAIQTEGPTAVRKAWSVSVKRVLTSGGPKQPGYVGTLNEYNCGDRRIRWRTFQVYSRFGDLMMQQDNRDDSWNPAPDAGEDAVAMRVVCAGSSGRSVIAADSVSQLVLTLMQSWDAEAALPPLQTADPPAGKQPAALRDRAKSGRKGAAGSHHRVRR